MLSWEMVQTAGSSGGKRGREGGEETEDFEGVAEQEKSRAALTHGWLRFPASDTMLFSACVKAWAFFSFRTQGIVDT